MLARLQEDSSFSIYTQDADILSDGGIDVLLGTGSSGENSGKFFFWWWMKCLDKLFLKEKLKGYHMFPSDFLKLQLEKLIVFEINF